MAFKKFQTKKYPPWLWANAAFERVIEILARYGQRFEQKADGVTRQDDSPSAQNTSYKNATGRGDDTPAPIEGQAN